MCIEPSLSDSPVDSRLRKLGFDLPALPALRAFLRTVTDRGTMYVSGHAPFREGTFQYCGKVGRDLSVEMARKAAELAVLGCLASIKTALGNLDRVKRVLKLTGYVNCVPDFTELPIITDAASALLIAAFGEPGRHARTTVGVASLPFGVAVEIELIIQIQVKSNTSS
jgi:enamine deaminase RidA (YjgF/YER057c/UK114 family)